jgi:hypothetical protein
MAWQSPHAMGNGAGPGANEGGPLGTEYTLQGEYTTVPATAIPVVVALIIAIRLSDASADTLTFRSYALPPDRMAQPREG